MTPEHPDARPNRIDAGALSKSFERDGETVVAVDRVSFTVASSEFVGLVGPSGSGKSTLLSLLCGWEKPDAGQLKYHGLSSSDPGVLRWSELAILPQALGLLPDLTVKENVLLPPRTAGSLSSFIERSENLMAEMGILHLAHRYPHQASLGEQQRTACARALIMNPSIVLADEPTAHQDRENADRIIDALREHASGGAAIVVATHDPGTWRRADRVLQMRDGRLEG